MNKILGGWGDSFFGAKMNWGRNGVEKSECEYETKEGISEETISTNGGGRCGVGEETN